MSTSQLQTLNESMLRGLLRRLSDPSADRYSSAIALRTFGRSSTIEGVVDTPRMVVGADHSTGTSGTAGVLPRGSAA